MLYQSTCVGLGYGLMGGYFLEPLHGQTNPVRSDNIRDPSPFPGPPEVTAVKCGHPLSDWGGCWIGSGNSSGIWTVPETDTGGLVEHTKALERTMLKELGKLLA